jgi:hypothetical protein
MIFKEEGIQGLYKGKPKNISYIISILFYILLKF